MKGLVVITGASSGIGAAMAKRFSEVGHPLLLVARRVEKIEALGLENTICKKVDITKVEEMAAAIQEAEATYGPVDCLINNAGLMQLGQVESQDPSQWSNMFDVNVLALLNNMQLVVGSMRERHTGTIINVSSIAGVKAFANHAAYCGTKYAVGGITETLREEVADDNVRVMSLCPGAVNTELLSHTTDQSIKDGYEVWKDSMGGVIEADDIARTALFMYSQPQNINIREVRMAATRQQA